VDGFTHTASCELNDLEMPDWLADRLGPTLAKRRIKREQAKEAAVARHAAGEVFSFWHMVDVLAPQILRLTGLLRTGRANAARLEVTRNTVHIQGLPDALTGFTLLHLTDLHADISRNAMRALPQALSGLSYDLCVITGDFRGRTYGPFARTVEAVRDVVAAIRAPILAVLGNHDTVHIVPALEAMGIQILLNEATAIERGGERLWIAGVDDPHYYRTDDIAAAISKTPAGEPVILLAHSTECVARAADAGVTLMLCGHTHGGQICLPGSIPVLTSTKMPRRLASGSWRHGGMHGYTSRGVGTSAVDVRFNCPPEVVLHTLTPGPRF
jgi:uncharacterized protein